MSAVCRVCGTPAVPGAKFCYNCGSPLGPVAVEQEAERRVVTVLFGDLSDFTAWAEDLDPEQVGSVTDRVLAALAAAVTDFGGHVDKLTGDGIMAVFGAPTAHEDDAERAVRAALRMQSHVRRLVADEGGGGRRLGLRVGLNTGEVLAGIQAALSYTVVGDTVNTASRLADEARVGSVYAGRETALATMQAATWRALQPLRLKGKRDLVDVYELVGLRPEGAARIGLGEEAPLIGREAELGRVIGRFLDVADRRKPATIVVAGEPGVGKTRLVAEAARFVGELPEARVLWGRARPFGEERQSGVLIDWVRTACGIDEDDQDAVVAERVRRTVGRLGVPTARTFGLAERLLGLLGVGGPYPQAAGAPGAERNDEPALLAVVEFLDLLAANAPLLLIADDLNWAGAALLSTLTDVIRLLRGPVLVTLIGRSDMFDAEFGRWWNGLPDAELLALTPLEEAASERLLRAYLGGAELDDSARKTLLERAQGNPYFLAELLHLLVDRGLLRRVDGTWMLAGALPSDVIPAGVQGVLAARFDSLNAGRALLADAAVIGDRITVDALRALGHGDEEINAALTELVERGILVTDERGYRFRHSLARDAAYARLPKTERARRHATVATWAASRPNPPPDNDSFVAGQVEHAVELAREMKLPDDDPVWAVSDLGARALDRLASAALGRDDYIAADAFLQRALSLVRSDTSLAQRLHVGRARSLVARHRLAEAAAELDSIREITDPVVRALALTVQGDISRRQGDIAAATARFQEALDIALGHDAKDVAAEAVRHLGAIEYFSGRLRGAERRFREALAMAREADDERAMGWALQHLAWNATTRGSYDEAEHFLSDAADLFSARDDLGGLSWCAGTEAMVRLLQGRLSDARQLAQGLLPVGTSMGERWGVAVCLTIDATAAAELGDLDAAEKGARDAQTAFARLGDMWGRALAQIAEAMAARARADYARALQLFDEAARTGAQERHPLTQALALVFGGYTHLDADSPSDAEHAVEEAAQVISTVDLEPHAYVGVTVLRAQVARALGRRDEALALLANVAAAPAEPTLLFPRRQALAHYAGTLLEVGRVGEAVAIAERARDVPAEDVRSRVLSARALAAAYAAADRVDEASKLLDEALALATDHGYVGEAAQTQRVIERVLS